MLRKALVMGASGATGKLLVAELLQRDIEVSAIVRASSSLTSEFGEHTHYSEIVASITDLSVTDLSEFLENCDVVFSCLGHNLSWKGIFGEPKRLVRDSVEKICGAVEILKPENKIKIVLMNTVGNANRDIPEKPPLSQRVVVPIIRLLLPPHADNEQAADYLRLNIGQDHDFIEWSIVRPDSLTNEERVSDYTAHPSPTTNAIFNAGQTSRINVANFMTELAINTELWNRWKGKMPVIYNDA